MKNTNIKRTIYHIRNQLLTTSNVVIVVALLIAASWAWGSVGVVQKNYALQRVVDDKRRQAKLVELETDNLAFEQKYYHSGEYQELAARERFGLALPGEKVLVLPPNTPETQAADKAAAQLTPVVDDTAKPSNFQQWANFLFGSNRNNQV